MTKAKNFDNCIIYKLVCLDTTYPEVYVGSTTCFKQRKYDHKSRCYNDKYRGYNYKVYQYMREHGGFENFAMIEIEKYPCQDSRQLEAREEHWRKELKATLNGKQAFTTEDELKEYMKNYYETHKDERLQYNKNYHETHKDERLQQMKKYRTTHKDEIKQKNKAYRTTHKEEIKQNQKDYRNANKDKRKAYMKDYRLRKKLEKLNLNETI